MKKLYIYPLILLAITAIASSCTKGDEGAIVPQGNELVVKAELISSSAWASRAAGDGVIYGNSSQTDDGEYIITAQKQEWKGDTTIISNAPTTRGTPIGSASGIANMRINVFNTGTTNWTTSSTLTQALTATNSGGGFSVSPLYSWPTNATTKTTLFAFSPTPTGSNGITDVAPNKITYLVPTTVGNQPDLCTATPSVDIINSYGTEQSRIFYMNHQLTAVGFSMLGWNLKITSITLSGIAVEGTLTMNSNGTSSWATSTRGSRSVGVTQNSYQHTINNSYANITTSDGYLMMIPQALSADATVTINYTSTGTGSASGTTTAKLNELGVTWNAGDKITYNIRLKTAPAVTSGDLIINSSNAGYTTTNPVSMVMDNRDNLTFTWDASWLMIHKGAPKEGNTSGGALSGWTTGTGGPWSNIYFFSTNDNTSTIAERTASVTVTGSRSGSKTFNVKQVKAVDVLTGSYIPKSVLLANGWPADRLPSIGLQVAMRGNRVQPGGDAGTAIDPKLQYKTSKTSTPGTFLTIATGKSNTAAMAGAEYPAAQYCRDMGAGWYLPSLKELELICQNVSTLGDSYKFTRTRYVSSTEERVDRNWVILFDGGGWYQSEKTLNNTSVRCVREI